MKYFIMILLYLSSFIAQLAFAEQPFFNDHEKGWHWYDDPKEEDNFDNDDESISYDPIDQMNTLHETVKRSLDQAILNPTKENVKNYIILQQKVTNQSKLFSNSWKEVLLENPELDFSLKHPTNNTAKMLESDQTNAIQNEVISRFARHSGLFFFYRSTCPYCRAFAPILKNFSEEHHIKVIAISTNGIFLPEFPHSYTNQGQAEKFNVRVEPALFSVNPYTKKAIPVSYGLLSEEDLKKRILEIAVKIEGKNE